MTLKLTRDAFEIFYGANNVFIVGVSLVKKLPPSVRATMKILVLASDGSLCSYKQSKTSQPLIGMAPMGAPPSVMGFIVARGQHKQAVQWAHYVADHSGREMPLVKIIPVFGKAKALFRALIELSSAHQVVLDQRVGQVESEVVSLRKSHEQALVNVEKARRMLRAVGFDNRMLMMSLAPSEGVISCSSNGTHTLPHHDRAAFLLPVNAVGLRGISLHCVLPKSGERAKGHLVVAVYRAVDHRSLGELTTSYEFIQGGWVYFPLSRMDGPLIGEAKLVIEWCTESEGAVPEFSATEGKTQRFGALPVDVVLDEKIPGIETANEALMPAMQLWSGVISDDFHTASIAHMPYEFQSTEMIEFLPYVSALPNAGLPEHLIGGDISENWLQTSFGAAMHEGFLISGLINQNVAVIEIEVGNPGKKAYPCGCIVMAVPASQLDHIDIHSIIKSDAVPSNLPSGCVAGQAIVLANQTKVIAIELPDRENTEGEHYHLVCISVMVAAMKQDQIGTCRWKQVRLGYQPETTVVGFEQAQNLEVAITQQMQATKFIEIAENLKFLAGDKKLSQLTSELGFSPMMVTQDNGSLQTHPINDAICATTLPVGAEAGTRSIMCEVETAHESAPTFIYVLALINSDLADKYGRFETLVNHLTTREKTRDIIDATGIEFFCTRKVRALETSGLSIDLERPLDEDHDIIFAALPSGESCAYGWCRWQFLMVSRDASPEQYILAPSDDERASKEP